MLIDFIAEQHCQFEKIISKVQQAPEVYLAFETVADVYRAQWLKDLPAMCKWYVSGLDDGAEDFNLSVHFQNKIIVFSPYQADF